MNLADRDGFEVWEEAFCKLVDHANEQVVVGLSVQSGEEALLKLCGNLAEDPNGMPHHTVQSVNSYLDRDKQLAYGSTFGEGARAISEEIKCWTKRFNKAQELYRGGD